MFGQLYGKRILFQAFIVSAFLIHYARSVDQFASTADEKAVHGPPEAQNVTTTLPNRTALSATHLGPVENVNKTNSTIDESEVTSLLSRQSTLKPLVKSNTTEPSIDKLIYPKARVSNNSRFNITAGGTAALTCATIAVVFYAGIMIWRKMYMNAYSNREILLNDDDIGDINDEDMRHFELKLLDKDGRVIDSANKG